MGGGETAPTPARGSTGGSTDAPVPGGGLAPGGGGGPDQRVVRGRGRDLAPGSERRGRDRERRRANTRNTERDPEANHDFYDDRKHVVCADIPLMMKTQNFEKNWWEKKIRQHVSA